MKSKTEQNGREGGERNWREGKEGRLRRG